MLRGACRCPPPALVLVLLSLGVAGPSTRQVLDAFSKVEIRTSAGACAPGSSSRRPLPVHRRTLAAVREVGRLLPGDAAGSAPGANCWPLLHRPRESPAGHPDRAASRATALARCAFTPRLPPAWTAFSTHPDELHRRRIPLAAADHGDHGGRGAGQRGDHGPRSRPSRRHRTCRFEAEPGDEPAARTPPGAERLSPALWLAVLFCVGFPANGV